MSPMTLFNFEDQILIYFNLGSQPVKGDSVLWHEKSYTVESCEFELHQDREKKFSVFLEKIVYDVD